MGTWGSGREPDHGLGHRDTPAPIPDPDRHKVSSGTGRSRVHHEPLGGSSLLMDAPLDAGDYSPWEEARIKEQVTFAVK